MAIRLVAIDIDGTLLDSRWELPEAKRKAIAEAVGRGIEVALVTGRRFDFALPIAQQLRCRLVLIVNNGALVKSKDGTTHLRHLLPRDIARRALQATPHFREGTAVVFDRLRENQVMFERIDWEDPGRKAYFDRNREFIGQASPLESCLTEDPIQVMYTGPVERMREVEALLRALPLAKQFALAVTEYESRVDDVDQAEVAALIFRRGSQFALAVTEYESRDFGLIDVIHPACSKGATLAEWAALRGFVREEVMAIGDNFNDREMLEFAGVPVVMGNSVPELKQLGWRVTLSNDQNGVAAAIEAYALVPG